MPCVVYSDSLCGGLGLSSGDWRLALRRIRDADEDAGVPAICVVTKVEPVSADAAIPASAPVVGVAFVVQVSFPPLSEPGQVVTQVLHGLGDFPGTAAAAGGRADHDLGRIFLIVGSCSASAGCFAAPVVEPVCPLNPSTALSSDLDLSAGPAFAQTVYRGTVLPMADRPLWATPPSVRHITYCHGHLLRFMHTYMTATNDRISDAARTALRSAAAPAASNASLLRTALDRLLRRSGPGDYLLADMVPELLRREFKRLEGCFPFQRTAMQPVPKDLGVIMPWVAPDFELCTLLGVRLVVRGGTAGHPRPVYPDDELAMLAEEPERRPETAGWRRIMATLFPGPEVRTAPVQRCAFVPVSPPAKRARVEAVEAASPVVGQMDARAELPEGRTGPQAPAALPFFSPPPLAEVEAQLMRCSAVSADPVLTRLVADILPGGGVRASIDAERGRLHALQAKRTQLLRSVALRVVEYYVRAKPLREGRPPPHTLQFLRETIERDVGELQRVSIINRQLKNETGQAMLRIINCVEKECGASFMVRE
jgi:hypothetical protein